MASRCANCFAAGVDPTLTQPHWVAMFPFLILLAAIALAPLFFADWWGRHYPTISFALAALVIGYYLVALQAAPHVLRTSGDYLSFIALIGSLFVVSGAPVWEFVERAGNYAAPLALAALMRYRRSI